MPEIFMPRLSDTMEEGTLSTWLKNVGDRVEKGDVLADIETDKATMELEAYDAGVLERVLVQPGETVPIGTPIAVIGSGEGVSGAAKQAGPAQPAAPAPAPATVRAAEAQEPPGRIATPVPEPAAAVSPQPSHDERVRATPVARALARDRGIDLRLVKGSGPGGRVIREDVETFEEPEAAPAPTVAAPPVAAPSVAAPPVAPAVADDVQEIPLTNVRRITARRLVESMQQAPHFYLTTSIDAEALVAFRADLNARLVPAGGPKLSLNDLIVKACATALRASPQINVSWAGDKILRHNRVNVGVAVALEAGLIVPVIRDADRKSVSRIAEEAKALIDKARSGKLTPDEFTGGTFTVSNLGMYGISHFTAVINPPEAAIVTVGATTPTPVARNDELVIRPTMNLTLSIDHRALDGATGAQFLQQLKAILEEPLRIVA
ncbi:MAG TPA: pyruvate dehydrogenase complex dihydrolipoamide acetyltransferase [Mycobacteriales bacterium]|nr:pyruvate dehydrogenase complex dihydrolipoamide acetyltransferase [Mycobacteriales bacterium]